LCPRAYLQVPDHGDPHLLPCCGYLLWRSRGLSTDSWRPPWGHRHDHRANSRDLSLQSIYIHLELPQRLVELAHNYFFCSGSQLTELYIEAAACPLRLSVWEKDTTPCYHLVCFRSRFSKSESATTVHIKIKAAACVLSEIVLESEVYSVWWYLSCSTNHGNLGCCPPFADSVVMMFSIIEFEAEATIHPLHASSRSRSKSTRQPALINTTPSQFCWFPSDWSPWQVV
jgi:hypothetical protein